MFTIDFIEGNATELGGDGPMIIAHICHDIDGGSHALLGFDDLGGGDNYLVACVPPDVEPAMIKVRQDMVYDPTNNPNPETAVEVVTRR